MKPRKKPMSRIVIGLAGFRQTGKSKAADYLKEKYGFQSVHPFNGGKAACMGYYTHLGIDEETAHEMIYGDLKDTPHPLLPGGVASRLFMERFGYFLGEDMGKEWTIGAELERMERIDPNQNLIVESIVYEVDELRKHGGHIIMVTRPGTGPESTSAGLKTDEATQNIVPDSTIVNDFETLEDLYEAIDRHLEEHCLLEPAFDDAFAMA
jgi:hypothetical protein